MRSARSMRANVRTDSICSCSSATLPPPARPASTQPDNATTSTGSRSCGSESISIIAPTLGAATRRRAPAVLTARRRRIRSGCDGAERAVEVDVGELAGDLAVRGEVVERGAVDAAQRRRPPPPRRSARARRRRPARTRPTVPIATPMPISSETREHGEEADDPEAELADHVLAPGLLEQVLRALERVAHTEVLEHEDRHDQERHQVPREADEPGDDACRRSRTAPRSPAGSSVTVAVTIAHGSSRCSRELAMSSAVRSVESLPRRRMVGARHERRRGSRSAPSPARGRRTTIEDPADRLRASRRSTSLSMPDQRDEATEHRERRASDPIADSTGNHARVLSDLRTAHERLAISHEVWNRPIDHQYRSSGARGEVT